MEIADLVRLIIKLNPSDGQEGQISDISVKICHEGGKNDFLNSLTQ